MPKIAIVVARYGVDVIGGGERLARGFAEALVQHSDWDVEVLTSCAKRHTAWENEYAAGVTTVNGVTIKRFAVTPFDYEARIAFDARVRRDHRISAETQQQWIDSGEQSHALIAYLHQHAVDYDYILCLPYISTIAYTAAWIAPEKTILWPCFHDEPFAYFEPFRLLMQSVYAAIFLTPEEASLAQNRLQATSQRSIVLGMGVGSAATSTPRQAEDKAQHATRNTQYVLYIGRLVSGKNVHYLYDFATRHYEQSGVRLVVIGNGGLTPPDHPAIDYRGIVSDAEKAALLVGALVICQPSLNESFSIVIMEGWLAGRPTLVHADCPVTVGHITRSNGGLSFATYAEYVAAVNWLLEHGELANQMGTNGSDYVNKNYRWPIIINRFNKTVTEWKSNPRQPLADS